MEQSTAENDYNPFNIPSITLEKSNDFTFEIASKVALHSIITRELNFRNYQ